MVFINSDKKKERFKTGNLYKNNMVPVVGPAWLSCRKEARD